MTAAETAVPEKLFEKDVSVIIVNYNTKEYLRSCLQSIFDNTKDISFEILVSDNGSKDGSAEMVKQDFKNVVLIENNANLGFGAANNRALENAKGRYILYLNSDTVLLNNALKYFFDFFETYTNKNELGALGCNLLDRDNHVIHSWGDFPSYKKTIAHYIRLNCTVCIKTIMHIVHLSLKPQRRTAKKTIGEIDGYISAAALFLPNNAYARFDEDFFLYYEEVDLQYKIFENQKKRFIIEGPRIIHFEGVSNRQKQFFYVHFAFTTIQSYILSIIYFKKRGKSCSLLKTLLCILLANPFVIKETGVYIKKIAAL